MKTRSPISPYWTLCGLLIAAACDGGPVGFPRLVRDDLVGAYVATTFLVTMGAGEIDVLERGGVLFITLQPMGTTTGTLSVPDAVVGEEFSSVASGSF